MHIPYYYLKTEDVDDLEVSLIMVKLLSFVVKSSFSVEDNKKSAKY